MESALSDATERRRILLRLEKEVQSRLSSNSDGHDWDHTLRVRNSALHIAKEIGANLFLVEAAALVHDIARPMESRQKGNCDHAALGAEMLSDLLPQWGVTDPSLVQAICHCVRCHRYRRRPEEPVPDTPEAMALFDADKLDSLGAIGVARAIHFAGHIGARVHNRADEALASPSYSREDSAYREYLVKLRHIPGKMLTAPGRRMAAARKNFMDLFFQQINRECEES